MVVGTFGPGGFLSTLDANPFQSRNLEDITVNPVDGRMLVTLIVVGTRKDDGSVHRYRNIRSFFRPRDEWIMEFWVQLRNTRLVVATAMNSTTGALFDHPQKRFSDFALKVS